MNRKLALAASVSASVVLVAGAVMLGTLLTSAPAVRAAPELTDATLDPGSSTASSLDPVVVYQDEYEYVSATDPAPTVGASSDAGPAEPTGGQVTASVAAPASAAPDPASVTAGPTPTTASTRPTTTTTTRPPGVPSDWPADKPIPPMPANCRQPQLEDNGVWNCQR